MSSLHFSPGLFVQHADENVFVLVDLLHDVWVALAEADEERKEEVDDTFLISEKNYLKSWMAHS